MLIFPEFFKSKAATLRYSSLTRSMYQHIISILPIVSKEVRIEGLEVSTMLIFRDFFGQNTKVILKVLVLSLLSGNGANLTI